MFWFTFTLSRCANPWICGKSNLVFSIISEYFSHLTDTEHIEGGGVERFDVELLRSQRLNDHCLSGSGQIGDREVSRNRKG